MHIHPQAVVGRWQCDQKECLRSVEYDGSADALFNLRRRNKGRRWMVFTRGLLDKLFSFVINARTTYTAATRHLSADVLCFDLRRQDVVKLGTAMLRVFLIPPQTARCPICGPDPEFIVIDGQALGCTDADDAHPTRVQVDCPVLDIPASNLCIVAQPPLRAAITKVLRSSARLTETQCKLLHKWSTDMVGSGRRSAEGGAAYLFFHFFPLGTDAAPVSQARETGRSSTSATASLPLAPSSSEDKTGTSDGELGALEGALRSDDAGNVALGGAGQQAKRVFVDAWRERTGLCAPNFAAYPSDNDGAWLATLPFLQALLSETVSGMFQGHNERAVRLVANVLRLKGPGAWRRVTKPLDGVGFVASFLGQFEAVIDADSHFRIALGELLLRAVNVEQDVDAAFDAAAQSKITLARGWQNAEYCDRWAGTPTRTQYLQWRAQRVRPDTPDEDDPLVSFEYFAGLFRVRPGITDSEAAKRRVGYRGRARHAADMEGDGDACNKAFSLKYGLTQGVFNVVCPHVITLGFRCLFRAESVGEALSIVLERFPRLPKVIFYDVACKLDKNALRRVRPILRKHGVRCILDRPHSITHTCSPVYMPDESLGATAGVATQAAEVSHSIAVGNRTSLAYMSPATYMVHKMVQVAFMNVRKLQRMSLDNPLAENDHVPLTPFYHRSVARGCLRGHSCSCQQSATDLGVPVAEQTLPPGGIVVVDSARSDEVDDVAAVENFSDQEPDEKVITDMPAWWVRADREKASDGLGVQGPAARDAKMIGVGDERASELSHAGVAMSGGLRFASMSTSPLTNSELDRVTAFLDLCSSTNAGRRQANKARAVLTLADMRQLSGDNWLNDEVMNSFVALINHRDSVAKALAAARSGTDSALLVSAAAAARLPRTFMFGTYFYTRLSEKIGQYDYEGVRRWGIKQSLCLESVDRIIVPVLVLRSHWTLAAADVRRRRFFYYDSLRGDDHHTVIPNLRRWLTDEVAERLGTDVSQQWDVGSWPVDGHDDLPVQTDSGSCGVFALAVADCLSIGSSIAFSQEDMPVLRQRIALAISTDDLTLQ